MEQIFFTIEKKFWVFVSSFLFYYFCLGVGKTYVMRENVCILSLIWRVKKRKRNGRKGLWCAISGAHKRCVQRAIQGPTGPMCVENVHTARLTCTTGSLNFDFGEAKLFIYLFIYLLLFFFFFRFFIQKRRAKLVIKVGQDSPSGQKEKKKKQSSLRILVAV